ncbi:MAG: efflux RND transporter periplasmic adaptor subunit [Flavobacteriia bacterium]|nr:efflux RND transporter periplasmic adaptor subunit [Flavobacteriia bacterium]
MKKATIYITFLSGLMFLFQSCSESNSKLENLLAKKRELKLKLASLQEEINLLQKEDNTSGLPLVSVKNIENKTFVHKIKVQGNVETEQDVLLNAEMGGIITQVHVKEGQFVHNGQTLISLDVALINSSMQEIESQLEYANYMLDKQEELRKRGVGSEFEYKTAKNQVDALKNKIKSLSTQRGKSSIKAPFSGVIDKIFAKNGQVAGPQSPLLRLVNNEEINITADISEKHFENIKIGTDVSIRFPNYKDTVISAKISHIGNYIDPTNRTFRVMMNVKNNKVFLPNMLTEIEIIDLEIANSIVVPTSSVLKSQNNEDYIFIAKKKNKNYFAEIKNVKLIEKYDGQAKIESEALLNSSDKVVVKGARGIENGMKIKIIK